MDSLWPSLAAELKKELPAQQFDTWIRPLKAERREDRLILLAPNHHVLRWVRANLLSRIESRVERVAGVSLSVNLVLEEKPAEVEIVVPEPVPVAAPAERGNREEHRLNPSFTFDNFVNGKANQIARAAAIQVAENPGTAYNPLFIYGGVGLGKTHLLQAIGNRRAAPQPQGQAFATSTPSSSSPTWCGPTSSKTFDDFKRYYHSLDLLLIDDVQFFAGKDRTQEEFFYAFNALVEAHKQIVITCDYLPEGNDRHRGAADLALRLGPHRRDRAARAGDAGGDPAEEGRGRRRCTLAEDVAFFIAKHIRSNVRELEGALEEGARLLALHDAQDSTSTWRARR